MKINIKQKNLLTEKVTLNTFDYTTENGSIILIDSNFEPVVKFESHPYLKMRDTPYSFFLGWFESCINALNTKLGF